MIARWRGSRGPGSSADSGGGSKDGRAGGAKSVKAVHGMTPAFRTLLVSDILVRFCEQIPYAFMAIWVIKNNGLSPVTFGLFTTIEMVTAMLIYIPVAYLADRGTKKPFVTITFAFFTLFPLMFLFAHTFWMFVACVHRAGIKGIWRTDPQGADHGPGSRRIKRRPCLDCIICFATWLSRWLLSAPAFCGTSRRKAISHCLWVWRVGNALLCDFWSGSQPFKKGDYSDEMDYPCACSCRSGGLPLVDHTFHRQPGGILVPARSEVERVAKN